MSRRCSSSCSHCISPSSGFALPLSAQGSLAPHQALVWLPASRSPTEDRPRAQGRGAPVACVASAAVAAAKPVLSEGLLNG